MNTENDPSFKLIYSTCCSFGGWDFQAVSNGSIVLVQQRAPCADDFETARVVSKNKWDIFYEENLSDPAKDNPAVVAYYSKGGPPKEYDEDGKETKDLLWLCER